MRRSLCLLALACIVVCMMCMYTHAQEMNEEDSSAFIEENVEMSRKGKKPGNAKVPTSRTSGGGGVQRGGSKITIGPDLRKGTADGSELPPWDPFRIHKRQERKLARIQARRQERVERENALDLCRAKKERQRRREENERRELEAEAAEAASEKAKAAAALAKRKSMYETDLMEIESQTLDGESTLNDEEDTLFAELESEAAEDNEVMELHAAEFASDSAEAEADLAAEQADIMLETATDAELAAEKGRVEMDITYGREDMGNEDFDNKGGKAVFMRRARGQEIVRFEKRMKSSPGRAVVYVKGVRYLGNDQAQTDQKLTAARVMQSPGLTVEAAHASAPEMVDDNVLAIKRFPVVPQYHTRGEVDEYGDPVADS